MENEQPTPETMEDGRKLNVSHRAPGAAVLVLLFMSIFHASFVISAMSGVGANLQPTGVQMIFFGFWIGAGRGPVWLRMSVFALLGLYVPWVIDPSGSRFDKNLFWGAAQALEPIVVMLWTSALFSYLVPRCFLWRSVRARLPQFKLFNLLVFMAVFGLCFACWQPAVELILQNDWYLHQRIAISILPMGVVVVCTGGPLLFHQPSLSKRFRNYAIFFVLAFPVIYILAAATLGSEFLDMALLPFFIVIAAALMIYPMQFAFWSFHMKWLQILDEPEQTPDDTPV